MVRIPQLWFPNRRQGCRVFFTTPQSSHYRWDFRLERRNDNILLLCLPNLRGVEFLPLGLQCRYSHPSNKLYIADNIDKPLELPLWNLVLIKVFTLTLRPEPLPTCKHRCHLYPSRYLSEFSLPLLLQVNNFWRWGLICDR